MNQRLKLKQLKKKSQVKIQLKKKSQLKKKNSWLVAMVVAMVI